MLVLPLPYRFFNLSLTVQMQLQLQASFLPSICLCFELVRISCFQIFQNWSEYLFYVGANILYFRSLKKSQFIYYCTYFLSIYFNSQNVSLSNILSNIFSEKPQFVKYLVK